MKHAKAFKVCKRMFNETSLNVFISANMDRVTSQNPIEQINIEIKSEVQQNLLLNKYKRKLIGEARISDRPVFMLYLDLMRKSCWIFD